MAESSASSSTTPSPTRVALRSARALTRKMGPLVAAANAVAADDLDRPAGTSGVCEARAILDATHRLDTALIDIIAAWREGERDGEGRLEPDADSRG